jgi:4-hydroxythreonine-4-phosphate dehydrogenase
LTLVVTGGEPAGIGPELCAMVAARELPRPVVVIGDAALIEARARAAGIAVRLHPYDAGSPPASHRPGYLPVIDTRFPAPDCVGRPDPANAATLLAGLDRAIDGCRDGEFAAMVTAPLQKSAIIDAGLPFSGHTEYLAQRCGVAQPVMLLTNGTLRVALVTTHLPLRAVPDAITEQAIGTVLEVLWRGLTQQFAIGQPRILVCGLNPHAGEGGHLGDEDERVIAPAVRAQRAMGRDIVGPLPADTAFTPAAGAADAVLAMYHDQGLPVIKHAGFGNVVNVTLGLPIVRTSVDHGTALDIAGTGAADPGSLLAAIALADRLAD